MPRTKKAKSQNQKKQQLYYFSEYGVVATSLEEARKKAKAKQGKVLGRITKKEGDKILK